MASYQTIKDWPEEDRPREKLLAKGAQSLSETELLAIILRNGNASTGESAIDHARLLLKQFGGLKGIDEASFGERTLGGVYRRLRGRRRGRRGRGSGRLGRGYGGCRYGSTWRRRLLGGGIGRRPERHADRKKPRNGPGKPRPARARVRRSIHASHRRLSCSAREGDG